MRYPGRLLLGAALMATLLASSAHAQSPARVASLRAQLQAKLDSLGAAQRFPGATLAVALPNGTSFGIANGFADTVRDERMTPDHRLLQGSVGKTYFAALALLLVRDGRLDLDQRIEHYLGAESWWRTSDGTRRLPNGADITVRQLMNHTSGVVRYEFKREFQRDLTADPLRTWTPQDRLHYILDSPAPFAAGAGWEYSDTNYILLGLIIERITGESAYDGVRRRILRPHELLHTMPTDRTELPRVAQGYAGPNNAFGGADAMMKDGKFVLNPQLEWTGGGFASSSEDLARWGKLLFEGRVYGTELLNAAVTGVEARGLGAGARYGLGVIIRDTPLGVSYGHSGFFPGYLTELRYYRDHAFAIALQFNTSVGAAIGRNPGALLQEFAAIVAAALADGG